MTPMTGTGGEPLPATAQHDAPVLVLATRNPHKVTEVSRILRQAGLRATLKGVHDVGDDIVEVAETGATFAENALLKARSVAAATGYPALADDSGICVDALAGMPGVLSARWAGRRAGGGDPGGADSTDRANLELLLDQMADVPDERRGAHFACAAAVTLPAPDGRERDVEGRVYGTLTRAPRGVGGFGYDPVFVPEGETRTTAEMEAGEKDELSHRGRAFRALAPIVEALLRG